MWAYLLDYLNDCIQISQKEYLWKTLLSLNSLLDILLISEYLISNENERLENLSKFAFHEVCKIVNFCAMTNVSKEIFL